MLGRNTDYAAAPMRPAAAVGEIDAVGLQIAKQQVYDKYLLGGFRGDYGPANLVDEFAALTMEDRIAHAADGIAVAAPSRIWYY